MTSSQGAPCRSTASRSRTECGSSGSRVPTERKKGGSGRPSCDPLLEEEQRAGERVVVLAEDAATNVRGRRVEEQRLHPCGHARVRHVAGYVAHVEERVRRHDGAERQVRVVHAAREGLVEARGARERERGDEVAAGGFAGDGEPRRVAAPAGRVPCDPEERVADVLEGLRILVPLPKPVVHVEDEVAGAREGVGHHAVRLLGEHPEAAAVHVHHDRERLRGRARGDPHVEPMGEAARSSRRPRRAPRAARASPGAGAGGRSQWRRAHACRGRGPGPRWPLGAAGAGASA